MKINIVSVGIGNISSVRNMLKKVGYNAELSERPPGDTDDVDWVILPGVGSFDHGVKRLKETGWFSWLKEKGTESSTRIIGICLGMQLLCDGSEEGTASGLGLIPGYFKKFSFNDEANKNLKIPHMGWNVLSFNESKTPCLNNMPDESRFYFVHSYHYTHRSDEFIIGTAEYGSTFGAAIKKNNVIGFQFHPEKSHKFGKLLFNGVIERLC